MSSHHDHRLHYSATHAVSACNHYFTPPASSLSLTEPWPYGDILRIAWQSIWPCFAELNRTGPGKSAQSFSQKNWIENVDSLHSAPVIAALITALPAMTPLTFAPQFVTFYFQKYTAQSLWQNVHCAVTELHMCYRHALEPSLKECQRSIIFRWDTHTSVILLIYLMVGQWVLYTTTKVIYI